jgi:hypothetical protein
MDLNLLFALAILVLLLTVAGAKFARQARSHHLAHRLGPDYERARAASDPVARRPRVSRFRILPLLPDDALRYRMEWQEMQDRFVVSPRTAVAEADLLVREVMVRRGYPVADFEVQAAELALDHPAVVEHYRAAHAIALRDRTGEAGIESLGQAVVHYRALFTELLEPARQRRRATEASTDGARRAGFLR